MLALRPGAGLDFAPFVGAAHAPAASAWAAGFSLEGGVPFLSPPTALPLLVPIRWLGPLALPCWRLLVAGAAALAFEVLFRAVAPEARLRLLVAAILTVPLVAASLELGQSSPLLLLAAALLELGGAAGGVALAVLGALKVWPLLALVAGSRRAIAAAAVVSGALAVAVLASDGTTPFATWLELALASSPGADLAYAPTLGWPSTAFGLVVVGIAAWRRDGALALLGAAAAAPLAWTHYLVLLPAVTHRSRWFVVPSALALVHYGAILLDLGLSLAWLVRLVGALAWVVAAGCALDTGRR